MPQSTNNSNPPRVIQSGVAFGWSSLLTYCHAGDSLCSLWDESRSLLRQNQSTVGAPANARLPRRPAQVFLERHRIYPRTQCPPHTEINDTSERNLETKFSERVAESHRSFRVVDSFSFSTAGATILRASSAYRDILVGTTRISRQKMAKYRNITHVGHVGHVGRYWIRRMTREASRGRSTKDRNSNRCFRRQPESFPPSAPWSVPSLC